MANNYEKSEKEERVKKKTLGTGIICKREQGTFSNLKISKFRIQSFSNDFFYFSKYILSKRIDHLNFESPCLFLSELLFESDISNEEW